MEDQITTLSEAKRFVDANIGQGCICPVCNRYARSYKRKLNSSMARFLIVAYKQPQKYWRASDIITQLGNVKGLDYSVLRHFGLIGERRNEDATKRNSGWWTLTTIGIAFVRNRHRSVKYVHLYNNIVIGSSGSISITEALGNKFNYQELMNS